MERHTVAAMQSTVIVVFLSVACYALIDYIQQHRHDRRPTLQSTVGQNFTCISSYGTETVHTDVVASYHTGNGVWRLSKEEGDIYYMQQHGETCFPVVHQATPSNG